MNATVVRIGDAVWLGLGSLAVALVAVLAAGLLWDLLRRRRNDGQDAAGR